MKIHKARTLHYGNIYHGIIVCAGKDMISWDYSFRWAKVTCKKCLKLKEKERKG